MKLLIITSTNPPTPGMSVSGLFHRFSMFVGAFAKVSDTLDILHFVSDEWSELNSDTQLLHEFQSAYWGAHVGMTVVPMRKLPSRLGLAIFSFFRPWFFFPLTGRQQLAAVETCLGKKPDLVFVHRLAGMGPVFCLHRKLPPLLFDLDDVEHRTRIRWALTSSSWLRKLKELRHVPAMFLAERRAIKAAARTFVCSDEDRQYLLRLGVGPNVVTIPNAVSFPLTPQQVSSEKTILFLGDYGYLFNAEAAQRLISRIWPLVQRKIPTARLIVAGNSPECIPAFCSGPAGVEFTGFIGDLDALYFRSRLICCPLMNGSGTRIKLIEAAGRAKPMISTRIGAEGLSFDDGIEILIRDDDESIAEACIRLLNDDALCTSLGAAAQRKAQSLYDFNSVQAQIVAEVEGIFDANYSDKVSVKSGHFAVK
jgi:glycosyltransferase involved in cell wall biosynthesis